MPSDYDLADAHALQQLLAGAASPEEQKRALEWIIKDACGVYDETFFPGEDGSRLTTFAEGKRHVGLQIVKLLNLALSRMRR